MELKLVDGAYVTSGARISTVLGPEETAQRIMMKLRARYGGFAPMPEYGSRLHTLGRTLPSERELCARQYIAEALRGEGAELSALRIIEKDDGLLELKMEITAGETMVSLSTTV